jgi:spoIIIJ-associated protein
MKMSKSIISEGKTTAEAVENGLKELKVSKDKVEIKVLENEEKRSFFSILTPRIVKVELTLKENKNIEEKIKNKEYNKNIDEIESAKKNIDKFLSVFIKNIDNELKYSAEIKNNVILINVEGNSSGILIGYRGETLNSLQTILSAIANKGVKERIQVILNIANYKEKREKVLENLAEKVSKTVLKTGKNITLEPMNAYERKIIHSKLQNNEKIETYSIGEGENRRVVIAKK